MANGISNNIAPAIEQYRRTIHSANNYNIGRFSDAKNTVTIQNTPVKSAYMPSKKDLLINSAGFLTGMTAPLYLIYDSIHKVTPEEAKSQAGIMQELLPSADTLEHTRATAERILKDTGLKSKGLKINFIDKTTESAEHLRELISNEVSQNSILGKRMKENYFHIFKEGGNAAFFPKSNEIVMSENGLYDTVYHEIGHALNRNGNIFTKLLQKSRVLTPFMVSVVAPIALGIALFHKPDKTKPAQQKGLGEKTLDFISNHATGLTAISYIPLLGEEALASVRGLKVASKYLEPDTINKLAWNYTKAWGTYACAAAVVTGGVAAGIGLAKYLRKTSNKKEQV